VQHILLFASYRHRQGSQVPSLLYFHFLRLLFLQNQNHHLQGGGVTLLVCLGFLQLHIGHLHLCFLRDGRGFLRRCCSLVLCFVRLLCLLFLVSVRVFVVVVVVFVCCLEVVSVCLRLCRLVLVLLCCCEFLLLVEQLEYVIIEKNYHYQEKKDCSDRYKYDY